jgi:hypothetical protein
VPVFWHTAKSKELLPSLFGREVVAAQNDPVPVTAVTTSISAWRSSYLEPHYLPCQRVGVSPRKSPKFSCDLPVWRGIYLLSPNWQLADVTMASTLFKVPQLVVPERSSLDAIVDSYDDWRQMRTEHVGETCRGRCFL